jgi:hypothetical protein
MFTDDVRTVQATLPCEDAKHAQCFSATWHLEAPISPSSCSTQF